MRNSLLRRWLSVCVCVCVCVCVGVFSFHCADQERLSKPPLQLTHKKKRLWLHLALEKLLIHPNRHTCPFPVSVYYAAMILLWRLPLQWNTMCFWLSAISFSHHSRQAFAKPKALRKPHFCLSFLLFFMFPPWHVSEYFKSLRFSINLLPQQKSSAF